MGGNADTSHKSKMGSKEKKKKAERRCVRNVMVNGRLKLLYMEAITKEKQGYGGLEKKGKEKKSPLCTRSFKPFTQLFLCFGVATMLKEV